MKFTNLRLIGFKSFVDATDLDIRDGLTGVVGPNGCGKSNLLEALRWVMGATSAKALRGEGMSDVIFSGTAMRPGRNWAEVILTLDNADRSAPAEFNDADVLEVSRRIVKTEDGAHSIYRINAREVRAKDVQLLFADAVTGANSPALVRQGQISELINAKPQNRRRLLEEAAGVTGLHSRRHDAELRLRAAEQNLERLADVTGELEAQKAALARQARQAVRYRNLSGDIRRTEAQSAFVRWREATAARDAAASQEREIALLIEDTARAAAAASIVRNDAHANLDPLRLAEAEAAAALHRLTLAREGLDADAHRAESEVRRLGEEIERLTRDIEREEALDADARAAIDALTSEETGLAEREASEKARIEAAHARRTQAEAGVQALEAALEERASLAAENDANRRSLTASIEAATRRLEKLRGQIVVLEDERASLTPSREQAEALATMQARFAAAEDAWRSLEAALHRAEEDRAHAEEAELSARAPRQKAFQAHAELTAERDGLRRVLGASDSGGHDSLIEAIHVESGFEHALAAALGDDLDAALDADAPQHWAVRVTAPDVAPLPPGAAALSEMVRAPAALSLRLASIGVVECADGARLAEQLAPGQRLVSREGDLWRWDGYVSRAEAKTAAAIRLEQRNRLKRINEDLVGTERRAAEAAERHSALLEDVARRQGIERQARSMLGDARRAVEHARARLADLEREHERASVRLGAIAEALARAAEDCEDAESQREADGRRLAGLADAAALASEVQRARDHALAARNAATEARAAHNDLVREAEMRSRRLSELIRERSVWTSRGETATRRLFELRGRLATATCAHKEACAVPATIEARRSALLDQIAAVEAARRDAADNLAIGREACQSADSRAKAADLAAAEAREARARAGAQAEAALQRLEEACALSLETCGVAPEALLDIAEIKDESLLPPRDEIERRLDRYRRERETLGGVNLRADEELKDIVARLEEIAREHADCDSAIRKLRAAIGSLNREARERLNAAFETVNRNFSLLFTRLFNGGQAELRLIESDDVLEAGLEVFASPPGKKLASMSLMSGGEQALTATALIFAVFMANPAPVCVLDEVDAPLDDANTERFCRLLQEMVKETATRFIVITHSALSMSRMDRLYGVTMIERGVSQLVSVDLQKAGQLIAAE